MPRVNSFLLFSPEKRAGSAWRTRISPTFDWHFCDYRTGRGGRGGLAAAELAKCSTN